MLILIASLIRTEDVLEVRITCAGIWIAPAWGKEVSLARAAELRETYRGLPSRSRVVADAVGVQKRSRRLYERGREVGLEDCTGVEVRQLSRSLPHATDSTAASLTDCATLHERHQLLQLLHFLQ